MENLINPTESSIYKDAARSFVYAEIEKIESILNQNYPDLIKDKCRQIKIHLNTGIEQIKEREDWMEFSAKLDFIGELIDIFLTSNPSKSSWWAMALIKECYEKCNISHSDREILIIHYLNSSREGYKVFPDLLSLPGLRQIIDSEKPIDVFYIPSEAKHDIASIALIGHEVGHIYWNGKYDSIVRIIEKELKEQEDLFNYEDLRTKRTKIASHIEEFLCDKIGRFLLGPAFDLALLKFFIAFQNNENSSTHPPESSRMEQSLSSLRSYSSSLDKTKKCIDKLIEYFEELPNDPLFSYSPKEDDKFAEKLAESIHSTSDFQNGYNDKTITQKWNDIVPELDSFRPPFEKVSKEKPKVITPIDAVVITSLYYYGKQYQLSNEYFLINDKLDKEEIILTKLVEHLRYAISLYDFVKKAQDKYCGKSLKVEELNTTLWQMRERKTIGGPNPFVITPSIDPISQYSSTSVDIRLGNSFLINKTTGYTHITPNPTSEKNEMDTTPLDAFYDELFIPVGKEFILHPHQFVLAATLEYVSIPGDYYALVLGRSSWGRLGLNIATATTVHSGYRGCITLELRNLGETPLPLKVGLRIAQLCLIRVPINETSKGYLASAGKYIGPVGPEIPKIKGDSDWELLNDVV